MILKDFVEDIIKSSNFKPDNVEEVKAFINTYIYNLFNIFDLEKKDYIIYLSGPVTNINNYENRFDEMEFISYKAFASHSVYIINPIPILSTVDQFDFSYLDKTFICYCLLSISNLLIYDNRDDKYNTSIGTFSELSFALGRGIEILDFKFVSESLKCKDWLPSNDATAQVKFVKNMTTDTVLNKTVDSITKNVKRTIILNKDTKFDSFGQIIDA